MLELLKCLVARRYFLRATRPRVVKPKNDDSRAATRVSIDINAILTGVESVPLPPRLADVSVRGVVRPLIDLGEACG